MRLVAQIKKGVVILVIVPIVLIYVTGMHLWYWVTGKRIKEVK